MKKQILLIFILLGVVKIISAQQKVENLKIVWPEEYKWKIGSNQETKSAKEAFKKRTALLVNMPERHTDQLKRD